MEPNDLPIVVLPLELSDDGAAHLIDFLHELTAALQRHYAGQLIRRQQTLWQGRPSGPSTATTGIDPPF